MGRVVLVSGASLSEVEGDSHLPGKRGPRLVGSPGGELTETTVRTDLNRWDSSNTTRVSLNGVPFLSLRSWDPSGPSSGVIRRTQFPGKRVSTR